MPDMEQYSSNEKRDEEKKRQLYELFSQSRDRINRSWVPYMTSYRIQFKPENSCLSPAEEKSGIPA
jgi:hypothetical protein